LPGPNDAAIERVVAAYGRFHGWISRLHAPHFIELNLTLAQLKTLYLVSAAGPMRMSAIAEQLGTAPSTTSGVVDGLVGLGLLERFEDPADRRQVLVRPTPAAEARLSDFSELSLTRLRELLARMGTERDLAAIEHAINLLADAAGSAVEEHSA
jgi:DNA-binding MarR family transcriptional regulator